MSLNTRSKPRLNVVAADNSRTSNKTTSNSSYSTRDRISRVSTHQVAQRRADEPMPLRQARTTATRGVGKLPVVTESEGELVADPIEPTSVITLLEEALRKQSSTSRRTTTKSIRPLTNHDENVLYESSHPVTASNHRPSLREPRGLGISDVGHIPNVGVIEEEEFKIIRQDGSPLFSADVPHVRNVSPPVFLQAPASGIHPVFQPATSSLDIDEDDEGILRVRIPRVKRKPVPVRTLSEISRERLLSKYIATKPFTPSLLSFTEQTTPAQLKRYHPDRFLTLRYASSDEDILKKTAIERSRLVRAGFIVLPLPSQATSDVVQEYPTINPYTVPRAGSLHHLRSMETNTWLEDWSIGYADLAFIQKALFAFDLRMRTCPELWAEREHEILALFGKHREWETDWEVRWRVATWLIQYGDNYEEREEVEVEVEASFASPAFTRPELTWEIDF